MKTCQFFKIGRSQGKFRRHCSAAVVALMLAPFAGVTLASQSLDQSQLSSIGQDDLAAISQLVETPKIQLAILLDTSSSMDGLIDQTRNQLWQVVNEFASAKQAGKTPILEIALFDFGNDGNAVSAGYVRRLNGFTRELDAVSQGLFSLTTNGGSEYCGYAIETAINDLQWSQSASDIKIIFIAGNESFRQGPIPYQRAVQLARQNGISINTIHAGN